MYLATDRVLGDERVAIKILHSGYVNDDVQRARFLREVQLMRKVNHKNVVRTFDVGVDGDRFYFTMEFVPGTPLDQLIGTGGIDRSKLASYTIQMCEALQAIHKAGVIHRDLKPGNILVLDDGTLRLADFGVARPEVSNLTQHDEIIGSVCYIAPEVWLGKPVTPSADLYALGIILYELATGQVPFDGESPAVLMRAHLDRQAVPPKELNPSTPTWFSKLVVRLLAKDPNARPRDAREVLDYVRLHSENYSPEQSGAHAAVQPFIQQLENKSRALTGKHAVVDRVDFQLENDEPPVSVVKRVVNSGMSSTRVPAYNPTKRTGRSLPQALGLTVALLGSFGLFSAGIVSLLSAVLPKLPVIQDNNSFLNQTESLASLSLPTVLSSAVPHLLIFVIQLGVPALLIGAAAGSTTQALRGLFYSAGFFLVAQLALTAYLLFSVPGFSHMSGQSLYAALLAAQDQISSVALLSPLVNGYQHVVVGDGLIQVSTFAGPLLRSTPLFLCLSLYVGMLSASLSASVKEVKATTSSWGMVLSIMLVLLIALEGAVIATFPTPAWHSYWAMNVRIPTAGLVLSGLNWLAVYLTALLATGTSSRQSARDSRHSRTSSPQRARGKR